MTENQRLLDQIQALLQGQNCGVLATHGSEYPYTTLVGYASSQDCRELVFATSKHTRKYENIKRTPAVSMLIDSRLNQEHDFQNAMALTVLGRAQELEKGSEHGYLALYLNKHPYLAEFVQAPNCSLIRVSVARYILVDHFQNVMEYVPQ